MPNIKFIHIQWPKEIFYYEDAQDNELFQFVKSFKSPHISMAMIWLGKDEQHECISHFQLARRNEVLQFAKLGMGKMF